MLGALLRHPRSSGRAEAGSRWSPSRVATCVSSASSAWNRLGFEADDRGESARHAKPLLAQEYGGPVERIVVDQCSANKREVEDCAERRRPARACRDRLEIDQRGVRRVALADRRTPVACFLEDRRAVALWLRIAANRSSKVIADGGSPADVLSLMMPISRREMLLCTSSRYVTAMVMTARPQKPAARMIQRAAPCRKLRAAGRPSAARCRPGRPRRQSC